MAQETQAPTTGAQVINEPETGVQARYSRFDGAFDDITCPVCGSRTWHHFEREGVFCEGCNTKATLRPTNGDSGFIVDFDAGWAWAKFEEQLIPADTEGQREAFAKFLETDDGYTLYYLSVYAFDDGTADPDDWTPAWERDAQLQVAGGAH